ncbi:MAG: LLM class flavin-dependent oxidoreductase [Bryobacterales bacterium]|nr:LLM class flavin-dependent oxidoreductase [Bryobacterales bacterium]
MRYSILDLAPVKTGGTVAEAFRQAVDVARHAEEWGYTRYWLAEHHNMPGIASAATAVLIGHVAGATRTIRVGSGGIMLPNHAALVIAEQFGTLETLYPGRIDLGVGRAPGTDMLTARALRRGMESEDEFPRQVAELLAFLAPAGEGQRLRAIPGEGSEVPVWLLGSSLFSAQLAAEMGLPFGFASHFAPAMLHDALRVYREGFRPSRYLDAPYAAAGVPVVAAESDAEAERLATSPKLRFLSLLRGRGVFIPPPVESMDGLWSEEERRVVESKMRVAIVGGPETVRRKLADFAEAARVDEVILTSDVFDHAARLRSFALAAEAARSLAEAATCG